jgi:hypothetical protein
VTLQPWQKLYREEVVGFAANPKTSYMARNLNNNMLKKGGVDFESKKKDIIFLDSRTLSRKFGSLHI